jgi:polysaccharide deacetylase family protein (PEP-CTERM system associated)
MINALTVDVEDYFHVAALANDVPRANWEAMECRVERNTHLLLDLFDEKNVKGTFFVLGWVARRYPGLVRQIHGRGHEVACHGWEHALVFRQSPDEFRVETRDSKALLEDIIGCPVQGYRASTYSITLDSLWALDILAESGFLYDSSIFPIRHDVYGIPEATTSPGPIIGPAGGRIIEFPMSTAHFAGKRIPVSGGGYFRILPYFITKAGLSQLNGRGNPFVFYLHPWEVDPGQPRVKTNLKSRFRHYTNLTKTEVRLRRLVDDFAFAPMRTVLGQLGHLPVGVH